jgi:hypothetical protein
VGTPPYYAKLLEKVIPFMQTGKSPIDPAESIEITAFLEAAEVSMRQDGVRVELAG